MSDIQAVIIGKNYSTSLGVIEALGEAGYSCGLIKLIGAPSRFQTPEECSRYTRVCKYAKQNDDEDVMRAILSFADPSVKLALIPSEDYAASLLDRNLDRLSRDFYVPNLSGEQGKLTRLMDKYTQKQIAAENGVSAAKCFSVKLDSPDIALHEGIPYPCYTKPQSSIGLSKGYIRQCDSAEELKRHLSMIQKKQNCTILVEQAITVRNEYTVPGVAIGGRAYIPALLKKSVVGSGKHKGVTIAGEVVSASRHEELVAGLCRLMEHLGADGIFDIELLEDEHTFYLNEINLRYGAAGYALTAAGINLPAMYLNSLLGKEKEPFYPLTKDGQTFVSEKAALENYEAGYSSLREYRSRVKNAEIHFMTAINDQPAEKAFRRLVKKTIIKKQIGRLRKR